VNTSDALAQMVRDEQRIEALEAEVAQLRDENARLRGVPAQRCPVDGKHGGGW